MQNKNEDKRSPLAFFRDQWFESPEGKACLNTSILSYPDNLKFLRKRLEVAYLAGARQFSGGEVD